MFSGATGGPGHQQSRDAHALLHGEAGASAVVDETQAPIWQHKNLRPDHGMWGEWGGAGGVGCGVVWCGGGGGGVGWGAVGWVGGVGGVGGGESQSKPGMVDPQNNVKIIRRRPQLFMVGY